MLQNKLNLEAVATRNGGTAPGVITLEDRFRTALSPGGTCANPILPSPSADPWVMQHEGWYYYCESRHQDAIYIRKSRNFIHLNQDPGVMVWSAPASVTKAVTLRRTMPPTSRLSSRTRAAMPVPLAVETGTE